MRMICEKGNLKSQVNIMIEATHYLIVHRETTPHHTLKLFSSLLHCEGDWPQCHQFTILCTESVNDFAYGNRFCGKYELHCAWWL